MNNFRGGISSSNFHIVISNSKRHAFLKKCSSLFLSLKKFYCNFITDFSFLKILESSLPFISKHLCGHIESLTIFKSYLRKYIILWYHLKSSDCLPFLQRAVLDWIAIILWVHYVSFFHALILWAYNCPWDVLGDYSFRSMSFWNMCFSTKRLLRAGMTYYTNTFFFCHMNIIVIRSQTYYLRKQCTFTALYLAVLDLL